MDAWRNTLLLEIEGSSIFDYSERIHDDGKPLLKGQTTIDGRKITLVVDVDPLYFNHLPVFKLHPKHGLGFIPHLMPNGSICYLEHEGIVFDRTRLFDVVRQCFDEVCRTLLEGITGKNRFDFVNEFETYWARLQGKSALVSIPEWEVTTEIVVGCSDKAQPSLRIAPDAQSLVHIPHKRADNDVDCGPWKTMRGIFLPLDPNTFLLPPQPDAPFWTLDQIRSFISYASIENRERLTKLINRPSQAEEYLILQLPRPAGGVALFGLQLQALSAIHPLVEDGFAETISPIALIRRDSTYLMQRGGARMDLRKKRALLIGCGSVGGHIAFELARAGVGSLTLVDHDTLLETNTYRHVLGRQYWKRPKAGALKIAIEQNLPFSSVDAQVLYLAGFLAKTPIDTKSYDIILSAIGNPTTELALNEYLHGLDTPLPTIYTWLDPYGIGGHALLTGMPDGTGCFECLYTTADEPGSLTNQASFAAPNQVFHRSLAGCDSLHTPYGSLDAVETAHIATRLAIDVLLERQTTNEIRSWKGSSEAFQGAGFMLSKRYDLDMDELKQRGSSFGSPACRICYPAQSR